MVQNGPNGRKWSKMVKNGGPDLKRAQRTVLSARRARRMESRGPKGLQLDVGARRAPRLLVSVYIYLDGGTNLISWVNGSWNISMYLTCRWLATQVTCCIIESVQHNLLYACAEAHQNANIFSARKRTMGLQKHWKSFEVSWPLGKFFWVSESTERGSSKYRSWRLN